MYQQFGLKCPRCGDEIYSNTRHDFQWCTCHGIFIDGGWDYRRSGGDAHEGATVVTRIVDRPKLPHYFDQEKAV